MKKIQTVMIIFVIIGSIFVNINIISSILTKNVSKNYDNVIENQVVDVDTNTLDFKIVTEIYEYFKIQAMLNDFDIITTIFSSGLLFESENSLIVIGHGYFDSDDQYRIAGYTPSRIKNFAEQKQIVALLGCCSSTIKLDNEIQLTYFEKINLRTALHDLINLLDWSISHEFLPSKNIHLFDLDPGGGNGWSIDNPPPVYNIMKMAYSPQYQIYWDLHTETGVQALSNFILNHYMTAIHFHFKGEFLLETSPNSNSYYLVEDEIEYDGWISDEGVWDYLNFANTEINGIHKSNFYASIKLFDIIYQMMTINGLSETEARYGLAEIFSPIAITLCGAAYFLIKYAVAAEACALTTLAWIGGIIATIIGIALIITVMVLGISGYIKRNA